MMTTVFVVKSFGPEDGYSNLQAFDTEKAAEEYAKSIAKEFGVKLATDDDCSANDEFVEVEELVVVV